MTELKITQADAELVKALDDLVVAVCYAEPPKLFNGVLCYEARVPVEFVDDANAALARVKGEKA